MAKLSDTANVILCTAAARDDRRALPLPKLKAPPIAVTKTIRSMIAGGLVEEVPATHEDEVWARSETNGSTTLAVTSAGLAAIGIAGDAPVSETSANGRNKRPTRTKRPGRGAKTARKVTRARTGDSGGKRESKQDTVIALLRRGQGASIEEMMDATGWQAHSVRGFMSGALKKRLGLELVSEKNKKTGERRYYIAPLKSK